MGTTIQLIDFFEKGHPPVTGGTLNQTAWFINAATALKSEDNRVLNELTK